MMSRRALAVLVLLASISSSAPAAPENPLDGAPSRFAIFGGAKVHYKSLGTGTTALVFIHGWTCDLTFFREQVPAFDGEIRLVLVDLPGHGKSDPAGSAYTMDLFAKAVDAVLKDARVSKAVLAGHSMGTPVARQFYRLFPEKTVGIVAVDGMLRLDVKPGQADVFLARYAGPDWRANQVKSIEGMFSAATTPALRVKILATMTSAPQEVVVGALKGMFDPAVWTDDPIGVPLFALYAKSPYWTAEYEAGVRKLAPQVRFVTIDGAGHFLQLEKPAEVNAALAAFLASGGWIAHRAASR